MKTWILAIAMITGVTMAAQEPMTNVQSAPHAKHERMKKEQLTPQQRAELRSKQLTLQLDLTDKQQKEIEKLLVSSFTQRDAAMKQRIENRKAGVEPTPEERIALKNQALDAQIALKREMKKILSADQYAKLEKLRDEKRNSVEFQQKRAKIARKR